MSNGIAYFWNEATNQIIEVNCAPYYGSQAATYCDMFCAEPGADDEFGRFGKWSYSDEGNLKWYHYPVETFPLEFRTHLLLLGVS